MSGVDVRSAVLAELAQLAKVINDPAALGKIYERLVGYDLHEDDPSMSVDDLRSMILDMVREECHSLGIHVSAVGLLEAGNL